MSPKRIFFQFWSWNPRPDSCQVSALSLSTPQACQTLQYCRYQKGWVFKLGREMLQSANTQPHDEATEDETILGRGDECTNGGGRSIYERRRALYQLSLLILLAAPQGSPLELQSSTEYTGSLTAVTRSRAVKSRNPQLPALRVTGCCGDPLGGGHARFQQTRYHPDPSYLFTKQNGMQLSHETTTGIM